MKTASASLSAVTNTATLSTKNATDTATLFQISGTYTGFSFVFEGTLDGTNWFPAVAMAYKDGTAVSGTISPSDTTTVAWKVFSEGHAQVRMRCTAISANSVSVQIESGSFVGIPTGSVSGSGSAVSGATNITSTSATAFTVGPAGTTAPTFQVDASTANAATGVKIKGAAAAGGVAISAISSAGSESLTLDALGTGTVTIGSVSTGNVIIGTTGHTTTFNNSTGAVTVLAGGITVTAGGLTVTAGGASIGGTTTINASVNSNTSINTGTSTGAYAIGNSASVASTITFGTATATALTIGDGTTNSMVFDTTANVTGKTHITITNPTVTIAGASGSTSNGVVIAAKTITTSTTTTITALDGLQFAVRAPTVNQSGGAVTVTTVSSAFFNKPVAGSSVTITNNYIINTDASAFLTAGGTWTSSSTRDMKTDIKPMDHGTVENIFKSMDIVSFKKKDPTEAGFTRYGVIAEDAHESIGMPTKKSVGDVYMAGLALAGVQMLREKLAASEARIKELESKIAA